MNFQNLDSLRLKQKFLQETIQSWENRYKDLKRECTTLETMIAVHNLVLSRYHDLDSMGFGLNQLQFLWTTLREIARENNINPEEAVTKFLSDVERHYNNILGFQPKVESLRSEVNRLRIELLSLPLVGTKLVKLTQIGVSEQDIINIAAVFEKYVAGKDRESFVSELEHYGSLKSTIQVLSQQADKTRMELGLLQTQNNCSIGLQFEYLEKLKSSNGDGFAKLGSAYKGEESVSIQEIKKESIKPIENMESKLEVKYRLTGALSNIRPALIKADD
jgi:hypothetical protein